MDNLPINTKVITTTSSEFDKYNAFLKEALYRCANVTTPYDRKSNLPLTNLELEKFCDSAASLGLPVVYIGNDCDASWQSIEYTGYYAAYPNFEMMYEIEKDR